MKVVEADEKNRILEYLKKDIANCIYLYLDILNYGISTDNVTVWMEEDHQGIQWIMMKYYDSFQIYSRNTLYELENILHLIQTHRVSMISGPKSIIQQIEKKCGLYHASYGEIFLMDHYRKIDSGHPIEKAKEADAREIAELICGDPEIGGHYEAENLAAQLTDRIRTGTGRSYIIRESGNIAAHSAAYAETRDIAVVGGTIVSPDYRNTDYYLLLSNYLLQELLKKGKRVYTFAVSSKMINYHKLLHKKCGEYGKLELIK